MLTKLSSFIDSTPSWPSIPQSQIQVKQALTGTIAPYLKARFSATSAANLPSATPTILITWSQVTSALAAALPVVSLFPLVDLWRLALLDPSVGSWVSPSSSSDPIFIFLEKATTALRNPVGTSNPRNYILTVLRLLSNVFSSPALAQKLFLSEREVMTAVLVPSLLHADGAVRTAAASLAFNAAAFVQKGRVDKIKGGTSQVQEDEDWEVEIVSAVVEALDRETASEEVGAFFQLFILHSGTNGFCIFVDLPRSPSFDSIAGLPAPFVAIL